MNIHQFEYLIVLIISGSIPISLAIFHPYSPLKHSITKLMACITTVAIPFIIWDIFATIRGHWAFNGDYHLPYKIAYLPLEEYLFFFIIPLNCVFIWSLFQKYNSVSEMFSDFIAPFKRIFTHNS